MNDLNREKLDEYYAAAESWSADRMQAESRSRRIAWIVAGVAALVAVLEAAALFMLIPLKRDVPYTLLVDRQTGFVQALRPLQNEAVTADAALTRSFLVQYVTARESFDSDSLKENYGKVGLWSAGEARDRYLAEMNASNPASPLAGLARRTTIDVTVRSVNSLSANTALVRFSTTRTDPGGRPQETQDWAAVIAFRFSAAGMSEQDRLINPLGFQVTRYRREAETLPVVQNADTAPAAPIAASGAATPAADTGR